MVNMALEDKGTGYKNLASVLIPNPTLTGWEDLRRIGNIFEHQLDSITISMAHVTDLSVRDRVNDGYTRAWKNLISL
jgi:hypothetical protein